jgi:anti-sigma B factor antagonist
MEFTYVRYGEALIVAPVGRVDESTWQEFDSHVASAVLQASREFLETLIIDLSRVDYMSSRGLRALTMASQQGHAVGVSIRLAAPNEVMREILAISRYDRLFAVDDESPIADGYES